MMNINDDKLLQQLTENWINMDKQVPKPGTVVVADGFARNAKGADQEAQKVPKYVGIVSNYMGAGAINIKVIKQLAPGGTGFLVGPRKGKNEAPINPETIQVVDDVNSLNLSPDEMNALQSGVAEYSNKKSDDWMKGVDVGGMN